MKQLRRMVFHSNKLPSRGLDLYKRSKKPRKKGESLMSARENNTVATAVVC
jgi:hypothetical protein